MTPSEVALVLTKCAGYDRRTIGRADIASWHESIGDLDLQPCLDAVAVHHGESTRWCQPAHIRQIVVRARRTDAKPLRQVLAETAVPFSAVVNRRGLEAARAALTDRQLTAGDGAREAS